MINKVRPGEIGAKFDWPTIDESLTSVAYLSELFNTEEEAKLSWEE